MVQHSRGQTCSMSAYQPMQRKDESVQHTFGAAGGDRTPDPRLNRPSLYQLSYSSIYRSAGDAGERLYPTTCIPARLGFRLCSDGDTISRKFALFQSQTLSLAIIQYHTFNKNAKNRIAVAIRGGVYQLKYFFTLSSSA